MKNLLSLYDFTGNWSEPYRKNGWSVTMIDIKTGTDILTWDYRQYSRRRILYGIRGKTGYFDMGLLAVFKNALFRASCRATVYGLFRIGCKVVERKRRKRRDRIL